MRKPKKARKRSVARKGWRRRSGTESIAFRDAVLSVQQRIDKATRLAVMVRSAIAGFADQLEADRALWGPELDGFDGAMTEMFEHLSHVKAALPEAVLNAAAPTEEQQRAFAVAQEGRA